MKNVSVAVLIAVLLAGTASAWWCTGHMIVAEIATKVVSKSVGTKLAQVISSFEASGPWPDNADPVQVACWADDVKRNLRAMNGWHYVDQPYNPDNINIDYTLPADNIINQINNFYSSLKNSPNTWEENFAIAWLIHLIGDIHQPLHCVSLFDNTFPDGDVGGNKFSVVVDGTTTNLHSYWDSVCHKYMSDFSRPLNATSKADLSSIADDYMSSYTLSPTEKKVYDPKIMANESYWAAVEYAYLNNKLKPGATITDDYRVACEYVAGKQLALAGYRLGNQLEYLLSKL